MHLARSRFVSCLFPAAFAVLLLPAASQAVTIRNLTTATTVFHEDFESGGLAPSPGTSSGGPDVFATNSTTAPDSGPAQGQFYLKLFRNSDVNGQGNYAAFPSSPQTTAGDVIRMSMMVYLPDDGIDSRAQLILDNGDFTTARAWMRPDGHGNVDAVVSGIVAVDTGLDYAPNTWQEWDLQYAIGASTFSITVNGVTASGFASPTVGSVGRADLFNGSNVAGSFYLDAVPVPEPASIAAALILATAVTTWRRSRTRPTRLPCPRTSSRRG
ncbi:MAG TPA: hypothetical protein VH518_15550 [Tepidisphaeraceae bacterium]|jgi:hypothetical protein